jgi:hypothetical protein
MPINKVMTTYYTQGGHVVPVATVWAQGQKKKKTKKNNKKQMVRLFTNLVSGSRAHRF